MLKINWLKNLPPGFLGEYIAEAPRIIGVVMSKNISETPLEKLEEIPHFLKFLYRAFASAFVRIQTYFPAGPKKTPFKLTQTIDIGPDGPPFFQNEVLCLGGLGDFAFAYVGLPRFDPERIKTDTFSPLRFFEHHFKTIPQACFQVVKNHTSFSRRAPSSCPCF